MGLIQKNGVQNYQDIYDDKASHKTQDKKGKLHTHTELKEIMSMNSETILS